MKYHTQKPEELCVFVWTWIIVILEAVSQFHQSSSSCGRLCAESC